MMTKIKHRLGFASLAFTLALSFSTQSYAGIFPKVVDNLEVESFLGRWYEVLSTHPSFQKDCVCVTADYAVIDDKTLSVTNSCRKVTPDGILDIAEGTAKTTSNPAKLNVGFGGFSLPFWSNYWVVDLADDYRYAVITTPFRTPVWVLSRSPELSQEDLNGILQRLHDAGIPLNKLSRTQQEGCSYTAQ